VQLTLAFSSWLTSFDCNDDFVKSGIKTAY